MIFVGYDGLFRVEPIDKELDIVLATGDILPAAVGHGGQACHKATNLITDIYGRDGQCFGSGFVFYGSGSRQQKANFFKAKTKFREKFLLSTQKVSIFYFFLTNQVGILFNRENFCLV